MEKGYILICAIVILCCVNMFFISESSDTIGSASVNFKGYIFSIPNDFILLSTNDNNIVIHNPDSGLSIALFLMDDDFNSTKAISGLKMENNTKILSEGNITIDNITVKSVYYSQNDDSGKLVNKSVFYFEKFNSKFRIEMADFDYNNRNETINSLILIIDSLKIDYKMK